MLRLGTFYFALTVLCWKDFALSRYGRWDSMTGGNEVQKGNPRRIVGYRIREGSRNLEPKTPFPETGRDDGLAIGKLQPDFSTVTAHSARIRRSKRARRPVLEDLVLRFGLFHRWLVVEGSHAKRDRSVDRGWRRPSGPRAEGAKHCGLCEPVSESSLNLSTGAQPVN